MSDFTYESPSEDYKRLFAIGTDNLGLTSVLRQVYDGKGAPFPFKASSTQVDFDASALTVAGQQVLTGKNNFAATSDPTTANDSTQGYSVGSRWINLTTQKHFICFSASTGAAVWIAGVKNNYVATSGPTSSNDSSQGYSVGSHWINTTPNPKRAYVCVNASTGAAVWRQVAFDLTNVLNTLHNFAAISDPATSNDSSQGYSVGSVWVNTSTNKIFACFSASTGAAVWLQLQTGSTVAALPALYHDVRIAWINANTIRILAGSRCRSLDDTKDIVFASDYDVSMSNATPTYSSGGRTVAESANAWYYLYLGLDGSNRPIAWFDTANLAGGGSVANPAAYSTGRRQAIFFGYNNSSSDIESFDYTNNRLITWRNFDVTVAKFVAFSGGTATTFTTIGSFPVPPVARKIRCYARSISGVGSLYLREVGSSVTNGKVVAVSASAVYHFGFAPLLDASGNLQYKVDGTLSAALAIDAIEITEIP
jgi:hypothetical protein